MALINRISRLFRADFNAVLDQIEEPELLLKQSIRDMEDDMALMDNSINSYAHDQHVLGQRKSELDRAVADLELQIDLCFESGKDDLVRNVIRKKLEAERLLKRLQSKHNANEEHLEQQRAQREQNSATLESLQQKAELFAQRTPDRTGTFSEFDDINWTSREMPVGDDEVEIAYLRAKNTRGAS